MKSSAIASALFLGSLFPATAATLLWTGNAGDGDFSTAANWTPAQLPAWEDDLTLSNAGTVDYSTTAFQASNGNGDFDAKGTTTISNGTNFVNSGVQWMRITTGTLVVDDATVTKSGAPVVMGVFNGDSPTLDLTNATVNANGAFWLGRGSLATSNITATVSLSASQITTTAFNLYDTTPNDFTINFLGAGSSITSTSLGRRVSGPTAGAVTAITWETLWNEGILQFNGSSAGSFGDFFEVSDGTILSIPEPSVGLLAGIGLLALFRRKRI